MYCYVVKSPVFSLQRGPGESLIAPSKFSSLCIMTVQILRASFFQILIAKKTNDFILFSFLAVSIIFLFSMTSHFLLPVKPWFINISVMLKPLLSLHFKTRFS